MDIEFLKKNMGYLSLGNFLQDQCTPFIDTNCLFLLNETPQEIAEIFIKEYENDSLCFQKFLEENINKTDIPYHEDSISIKLLYGRSSFLYSKAMGDEEDFLGWRAAEAGGVLKDAQLKYDFCISDMWKY